MDHISSPIQKWAEEGLEKEICHGVLSKMCHNFSALAEN